MRVPLPWMGEYVTLPEGVPAEQVAADLVRVGLEEEAVHGGDITGPLVVGRVLEFADEPQKNGKVIRWCSVDVGDVDDDGAVRPVGIVCGAHNFLAGDLVVVVRPGAVLPGGFAVSARRTYGHVSDGMICSARELGIGDDHDGIIRLAEMGLDDARPGDDAIVLLGLDARTIEVNVTPDRGYALSVRGVAREYAHATGAAFRDPADLDVPAPTEDGFAVVLDDATPIRGRAGCDRYAARVVHGVRAAGPSPLWMQRRLGQAGMRPISLAVDVTNYVMLAVGQPLHAFDLAELSPPIVVRRARAGERLTTLDDVDHALDGEDLLITDSPAGQRGGRVLALAGVMGGASSEVGPATTDILIESAHFDPVTVARTARRHRLSTEASRRFERGVDHALADRAAELAVRLLVEYGGGSVGAVTDVDERSPVEPITMSSQLPARVVGVDYSQDQVVDTLEEIGCRVGRESSTSQLTVTPPSWRPDLGAPIDLVEEVARLRGYDAIPSVLPVAPPGLGLTHGQRARRTVARALAEHGLVEVLSYPFVAPEVFDALGLTDDDPRRLAVRLANPLSDEQPLLRTSLLQTLLDTMRRNVSRGFTDVGLFEIGLVTRLDGHGAVGVAPDLPLARLPDEGQLAALEGAVPEQPRRVAAVLAGRRVLPDRTGPGRDADWSDAVRTALLVGERLGIDLRVSSDEHAPWHPGRCARLSLDGVMVGHAGELHPRVVAAMGLPARTCAVELALDTLVTASEGVRQAVPISTFPAAKEDVALVVDATVAAGDVAAALREGAGALVESVRLFDVYTGPQVGPGKTSLAFALRMRAPDRTLTTAETARVRDAAVALAEHRHGAALRT